MHATSHREALTRAVSTGASISESVAMPSQHDDRFAVCAWLLISGKASISNDATYEAAPAFSFQNASDVRSKR
jgi:hypothetical protein